MAQFDSVIVLLSFLMQLGVCLWISHDKKFKLFPAFISYSWFLLISDGLLAVLLSSVTRGTYSEFYWSLRLLGLLPLTSSCVGELWGYRWMAFAGGVIAGATLKFSRPFDISLLRGYGFLCCGIILLTVFFKRDVTARFRAIGLGIFVFLFFPTIAECRQLFAPGEFHEMFKLVTPVSLFAAQVIWMWGFYRADSVDIKVGLTSEFFRASSRLRLLFAPLLRFVS